MSIFIHTQPKSVKSVSNKTENLVYHQMLPDFPSSAIQWIKRTHWIGPIKVPLDQIDTSNRPQWVASHEPDTVNGWIDTIKKGEAEPIILGKFPGHYKYFIIDAHHRFLAYEALKMEPIAYVGDVHASDAEQALTSHSQQYSGRSKIDGVDPRLDGI